VLLALKDDASHGYALIQQLRERGGRAKLRTGTVYAALARLQDQGLVRESKEDGSDGHSDSRRRYFVITAIGLAAARAEASRLSELLDIAREKDLIRDPLPGH
jgi:DNA-binding PadR family transcriptional regulator